VVGGWLLVGRWLVDWVGWVGRWSVGGCVVGGWWSVGRLIASRARYLAQCVHSLQCSKC
jgi:hypothetical protein